MSATLINRNADLAKLEADGFRLRIVQGSADHLLVENVPAVTNNGTVQNGTLYSPLELDAEGRTVNPVASHQCWWIGEPPCDAAGVKMSYLIANNAKENRGDGIETMVSFSRKRGDKAMYRDNYEKITTYVQLICAEAKAVDPNCDARAGRPIPAVVEAQSRIFRYTDLATTRAGIGFATQKLLKNRVAIIGIGGTGSYILDLLAKTPINELHIYDGAPFRLHSAFRAPGAPAKEDFTEQKKVDWFGSIYNRMHGGIVRHPYHVDELTMQEFAGFDFVFVAVDNAHARKIILTGLTALGVPFIDVGLDIAFDDGMSLRGMCRVTVGTPDHHDHIPEVVSFAVNNADEVYRNIQVADLNMMNAAMAVKKWKKLLGFYADDMREHHSLYTTATHGLTKEDRW